MKIKIIREKIGKGELNKIAREGFGEMVKGVVDIEKEIMALGVNFTSMLMKCLLKIIVSKKIYGE